MRLLATALIWLGNGLLGLALLVIAASVVFGWYTHGSGWVLDTFSPFNVLNYLLTAIVLAPGIGLKMGGEKLLGKIALDQRSA